jgi:hypothetical protein
MALPDGWDVKGEPEFVLFSKGEPEFTEGVPRFAIDIALDKKEKKQWVEVDYAYRNKDHGKFEKYVIQKMAGNFPVIDGDVGGATLELTYYIMPGPDPNGATIYTPTKQALHGKSAPDGWKLKRSPEHVYDVTKAPPKFPEMGIRVLFEVQRRGTGAGLVVRYGATDKSALLLPEKRLDAFTGGPPLVVASPDTVGLVFRVQRGGFHPVTVSLFSPAL